MQDLRPSAEGVEETDAGDEGPLQSLRRIKMENDTVKTQTQGVINKFEVLFNRYTVDLPAGDLQVSTNNIELNDALFDCMKYRGTVTIIVEVDHEKS